MYVSEKPYFNQILFDKANQLRRKYRHLNKTKKAYEILANEIKKIMGNDEFVYDTDGAEVITYKFHTKMSFQQKDFKDSMPALYLQYSKETTSRTFLPKV